MFERVHDADAASRNLTAARLADSLGQENDVSFAYLFGSFLEERRFRDVDVGVYLTEAAAGSADRALVLAERLGRATGYPVDVRVLNDAPLTFLFHALRGRVLLCRDEERLSEILERTAQRYLDIEPILRRATREAFAS